MCWWTRCRCSRPNSMARWNTTHCRYSARTWRCCAARRTSLVKCAGARARAGRSRAPRTTWTPRCCGRTCRASLSLSFDASGAPFGNKAALDIAFSNLSGQLRGQKASGTGQIARASGIDAWQFKDVNLRFGKTHVVLNGKLGDAPDLDFVVDADDLSLIDPEARGQDQCARQICRAAGTTGDTAQGKGHGLRVAWQRAGRAQCRRGYRTRQPTARPWAAWNFRDCSTAGGCCKPRDCNSTEPMPSSIWRSA